MIWKVFDLLFVVGWHLAMLYVILVTDTELWVTLLLLAASRLVSLEEK